MAKKKHITIGLIVTEKFYAGMGLIFKTIFKIFTPKKLPAGREVSDLNLLLFSGAKGLKSLKAVLLTVYNTWEKIPHVTIVTDGTPAEYFEQAMTFWPYPHKIKTWKEVAEIHRSKGRKNLVEFAELNVYARKIIALLNEAEIRPTLYSDTDVVWFGEARLPAPAPKGSFVFRMSSDNMHCYHMPIIRYFGKQDMLERGPLNSGVMYMSGSVYDHYQGFEELMAFCKLFDEPFPEQTTFALLADKLGDRWSLDEIILTIKDLRWPLIPGYFFSGNQFARHHVMTKKSWFWRDALYILLFKRSAARRRPVVSSPA
jgi:hypothetical protein